MNTALSQCVVRPHGLVLHVIGTSAICEKGAEGLEQASQRRAFNDRITKVHDAEEVESVYELSLTSISDVYCG